MSKTKVKKIQLDLTEIDGNAYALMGAFSRQARREGWSQEEINAVLDECRKSDYDHLLQTLITVCDTPEREDYED